MAGGPGGSNEPIVSINVTPLVDVVLVLLIVLMVSATAIASRMVPVELPRAASAEPATTPTTLAISIDERGAVFLEARASSLAAITARARAAKAADAETRAIVAADGHSLHARVIEVIDALRVAGVTKLAFAASAPLERATP